MENITESNVILFPKTIEYYQYQLTRMLETERYHEAIELLSFLLGCKADDPRTHDEWKSLLEWLQSSFPIGLTAPKEEEDDSEEDMLKRRMKEKTDEDEQYAKKLMDMLLQNAPMDKKILALEQLAYIDHPQINETLKRWLENMDLHPLVQFKVLQTLRVRNVEGRIEFHKCGENVSVTVEETPMSFDDFPPQMREILDRVHQVSEVNHPALTYFAEQTWKEFLFYIYGTSLYSQLSAEDERDIDIWAAALYYVVLSTMFGASGASEAKELYGITEDMSFSWEQAVRYMKSFIESAYRTE